MATVTGYCSPRYSTSELLADVRVLRRQVRHQDVLADRRPGAGARHVRAAAVRVDERRAVASRGPARGRACSASSRRSTCGRRPSACRARRPDPTRGARRAPPCRRSPRPSPSATPCRPRRRRSPRRARSRTRGSTSRAGRSCRRRRCRPARSPCGSPGLPDEIPELRALLDRHVELPAELADVRDARREHTQRVDLDRAARREREAPRATRRPRVSDARMSRARGPQRPSVVHAEVRSMTCALPSAGAWSAYHFRSAMPCAPPVTTRNCSSPSRITVRSLLKRAARREHRRVDDLPVRDVHLAHRDLLHRLERARAGDVEDAERGQVEHRRAVAHRQMLGVDDRRPPARVPLGLAAADPVAVLVERASRSTRTSAGAPRPPPRRRRRRAPARARRTARGARCGSTPTARPDGRSRTSC